jgi:NAD(P)-dependent dehydrogenase (short-subunit alcohol dehydrogenase family)
MTTNTLPTAAQRLLGKVSFITGAAQGIGLATALKFAKEGAIVIVCDVKQAAVDNAVKQCQAIGAEARGFVERTVGLVKLMMKKYLATASSGTLYWDMITYAVNKVMNYTVEDHNK